MKWAQGVRQSCVAEETEQSSQDFGPQGAGIIWNLRMPNLLMTGNTSSRSSKSIRKVQTERSYWLMLFRDRHPDHGRAAELVQEAFFKAGLQED